MPASDSGDELVFLSPEEEFEPEEPDTGASPRLRRSSRKRKSTAAVPEMSKGSCSKKKRNLTGGKQTPPPKEMPKTARTPSKETHQDKPKPQEAGAGGNFEALLLAMEGRLTAKLEKVSEASNEAALQAKLNSESLEQLESRVDANENCVMEALRQSEARIMAEMHSKVKELVNEQLTAAGFDPDLTAADMSIRRSAMVSQEVNENANVAERSSSYATAASTKVARQTTQPYCETKADRQEDRFWKARRSLRLWPIAGGSREGLEVYLKDKLRMDAGFIEEDLGPVKISRPRDGRSKDKDKVKDEYVVEFENKHIRDTIKASAANLANFRETAGMRLDLPDHLQRLHFAYESFLRLEEEARGAKEEREV